MTLEEYKNILITGTPSDRARAIAEAGNDRSLTDEEFHELTAMIKGVVRPGRLRAEAIHKGVPTEFRVPALRTPRTRREQQLKMVGDRAATMAWQLMALACVQELGFGADRLNRLYAEMRHNYEQLNEWGKTDGLDVAMEKVRRCACDALQTEDIVVENVDDEKTVQTLSRSYKEQEAEFLKRAVMMAAGRKACRQSLNVLNEESVRQKCAAAMAAATGSNLSPLRSGYASALRSSPDMGAKDQGGR